MRNDRHGVWIEVEGPEDAVTRFISTLPDAAPTPARIESVEAAPLVPLGQLGFRIVPSEVSEGSAPAASIPADLAPCADCLRELADPSNRRYRYPFINCTACGPRFTIVRAVPYDRSRTTMSAFTMCAACRREYEDNRDRRFHAEPNGCHACGPRLRALGPGLNALEGEPSLSAAVTALRAGMIVAVKGAGGFVLAVDARDGEAVARLRARKQRPDKPLAVMGRSLEQLELAVELDGPAREALLSPGRPIVLAPARASGVVASNVAPGLAEIGVFLPPTPLQHLLLQDGPSLQVMSSGNRSEEPIACDNDDAVRRLGAIADLLLLHDRVIHSHADDSVVRVVAGHALPIRRARGFVPDSLPLPAASPEPVLAVGAELKATLCLTRGRHALLSQHLGNLDDADTFGRFEETISKLVALAGITPGAVAHDLHPDLRSTRWARATGLTTVPVQHHHAHVAACLAEHGRLESAIGVAFDGTGFGPDGTLWGGEILLADLGGYRRLGHLRPLLLLGGEQAIRQPWRLAAAALLDAGERIDDLEGVVTPERLDAARALWCRPHLAARSSGAGRWFDAVAALCRVRAEVSYEGQAAIELEAAASADDDLPPYEVTLDGGSDLPFVIDLRSAVRAIAGDLRRCAAVPIVAGRFHSTMAEAVVASCERARQTGAPSVVALSGGCFQNRRLAERARLKLEARGFEVLRHRRVPCNDGGLAFGQAAVAAHRLAGRPSAVGGPPCA